MMTEFFESQFRILQLRSGQDGQLLDVFAEELRQSGFAQITARRRIRAAEHLLYWAKRKSISPATFDEHTFRTPDMVPRKPVRFLGLLGTLGPRNGSRVEFPETACGFDSGPGREPRELAIDEAN